METAQCRAAASLTLASICPIHYGARLRYVSGVAGLRARNVSIRCAPQARKSRLLVHATARPLDIDESLTLPSSLDVTQAGWLDAFYRFSRPHTVIGTAIGVISVSLLAIRSTADFSFAFFTGLVQALVPALLMNIYIVGLNQIFDMDIDKVNKPQLPLASGEYSLTTGVSIVVASALLSLGIGVAVNSAPLLWALGVSMLLGTAYSMELPFLRWKRSALAAASCILSVRAVIVQLAFYLHIQAFVLRRPPNLPWSLVFATGFMCFFSVVIALFKDIPDIEGDRTYGIQSFTVRMGQRKVFHLCVGLLQLAYAAAVVACSLLAGAPWSKVVMAAGHTALAAILSSQSQKVDLSSKESISSFYMFIWKLFYAEYLLIPLMR